MPGLICDSNDVIDAAITSNRPWTSTAPLSALATLPLADAAVTAATATAEAPLEIVLRFPTKRFVSYAGLLDTNLRQTGYVRCEAFADHALTQRLRTTVRADGRDRRVIPPPLNPRSIRFGASNWLLGSLPARDFRLYATNVHVVWPVCRAAAVRWTIWGQAYRPDGADDSRYRIAHAWAGDGITLSRHAGSSDGKTFGGQTITTASGDVWVEPGTVKRRAVIDQQVVRSWDRDGLADLAQRVRLDLPLVWLPNTTSAADCWRYGGLFRRVGDHEQQHLPRRMASTTINLLEWTE
ncbi:hypothetical protein TSH58p_07165 [Azospirillum sp. TSH58]|uniref:hypothetical protein n=1 Tax=Azospirillum sp. TSH58 TaxID=664962 RepID=UPI000D600ADE|nr:hypothetical protein [Azospirillum sp. TSH58]AWJ83325.1 hypothetical protein TSH58p_07165 [Azospirillum sp. TSH58]PWC73076.1 hypothetical protein TSH58_05115 [Azospirillum sp. TSH58]